MKVRKFLPTIWIVVSALLEIVDRLRPGRPVGGRNLRRRRTADRKSTKTPSEPE